MKVSDVLQSLREDGWYLVTTREAIASSSIRGNPAGLPLRASPAMILRPGPSTVFRNKPISSGEQHMRYAVVIEKAADNYSAYVPDLPGCIATGAILEETEQLIREAIELHLAGLREDGLPIP